MTAVVTGASGHLGGVVVRRLLSQGAQVRAVDIRRGPALDGLDVEFIQADVLDRSSLRPAMEGSQVVFHLAALISVLGDPDGRVWQTNVIGAENVALAALRAGAERMVHCSSVHAFDLEQATDGLDESAPKALREGLPVYDRSKAAGERAVQRVIEEGLDAVVVNPTGIIGPYDFGPSRMGQVFLGLRSGRLPALVAGAFDWVDVREVAGAVIAAAERGATGENYLLSGHHRTVRELARVAAEVTGVPPPRFDVPMGLARMWGPIGSWLGRRSGSALAMSGESLHALAHSPAVDRARASVTLGLEPRSIHRTIEDVYAWFDEPSRFESSEEG